ERSSHFAFPVLLPDTAQRDEFRTRLEADGVETAWYRTVRPDASLPLAEEAASRHCALPISAGMSEDDIETVIEAVRATRH
ncbi:MAG TPA: DegT/DnrJ/EryC1/StrS family aminotransferase, partial [Thermoleophilaceae bacterium]|nr:DegT/DnrJ/EryC1/StrS family aminotransferase [Thermoleophilaceae bacterium]